MKLLLYCTKNKKQLFYDAIRQKYMFGLNGKNDKFNALNGKIVAECDFEVEEIQFLFNEGEELKKNNGWRNYRYAINSSKYGEFYKKSCLSFGELDDYFDMPNENKKVGYAIHIKNLHIFDKPKELSEYYSIIDMGGGMLGTKPLIKAPQNMMNISINHWEYCFYNPNDINILISIRPEWLCKILNGEKTIEVRKKVLKEMLK